MMRGLLVLVIGVALAGCEVPKHECNDSASALWLAPSCHTDADGEVQEIRGEPYLVCKCRRGGGR